MTMGGKSPFIAPHLHSELTERLDSKRGTKSRAERFEGQGVAKCGGLSGSVNCRKTRRREI